MEDRLQKANDGAYNNLLIVALTLLAVYLVVSGFSKSKKQTYLDTAGTDTNTQQAQALRDAMNRSGVGMLMSVDGTDVDLIFQTAQQIKDYSAVADSYRVLYGSELTLDLQGELSRTDLQKFYDIVYKRGSNPTVPTTTTGGTPSNLTRQVKAKQTVNVRVYEKPQNILRQAKAGEVIGTYDGEADLTVTGKKERFVIAKTPHWLDTLYDVKVYVHKGSVTIS